MGVQGTRMVHEKGHSPYSTRDTEYHRCIDFTCPKGRQTNQPAGVAILLPTGLHHYIRSNEYPRKQYETDLVGRAGAIRIKCDTEDLDVAVIVVYARPETMGREEDPLNVQLWRWVDEYVSELPARCIPIILTDANGRVGSVRTQEYGGRDGRYAEFDGRGGVARRGQEDETGPVGSSRPDRENKNGRILRRTA